MLIENPPQAGLHAHSTDRRLGETWKPPAHWTQLIQRLTLEFSDRQSMSRLFAASAFCMFPIEVQGVNSSCTQDVFSTCSACLHLHGEQHFPSVASVVCFLDVFRLPRIHDLGASGGSAPGHYFLRSIGWSLRSGPITYNRVARKMAPKPALQVRIRTNIGSGRSLNLNLRRAPTTAACTVSETAGSPDH